MIEVELSKSGAEPDIPKIWRVGDGGKEGSIEKG
jgi:hypothetical protein